MTTETYETLRRHLSESWPDREHEDFRWTLGPISQVISGFMVRRVSALGPGSSYIYLSVGAFSVGSEQMREFFIMSPVESPRHVETLAMVAHFHSRQTHHLKHGDVLDLGHPWLEGSDYRHLLVSWPYALDARAASCAVEREEIIYLWLVPISDAEAQLVRERGSEALEEILEKTGTNLLDPKRPSVV